MADWLSGVDRLGSSNNGGSMVGGPPRFVWHTYEADPHHLSAHTAAQALIAAGNDLHFTFNPLTGDIAQILPASVAGRGLQNASGGAQTNREGSVCLQCEVIAFAEHPFTDYITPAGLAGWRRLVAFGRDHGIPDIWPAGAPPAYPSGSSRRSTTTWTTKAGHYGHSQVPENSHGDPGAIDIHSMFMEEDMPLTDDDIARIWAFQVLRRETDSATDTIAAKDALGYASRFGYLTATTGSKATVVAGIANDTAELLARPAIVVDIGALAAAILAGLPPTSGLTAAEVENAAEAAVRTVLGSLG